jgi:hypothetical protein
MGAPEIVWGAVPVGGCFFAGTVVLTLMFQEWALQDEWEYAIIL